MCTTVCKNRKPTRIYCVAQETPLSMLENLKCIYVHIYTHSYTCTYIYINTHIHIMSASFYLSLFFHIMCTSFYIPYLGGLDVFNRVSTSFHPHNTPILVPKQLTHSSHMQCCPLCQKNFSSSFPYLSRAHSPELGPLMLHCNF